jgi:hypothetical protein
VVPIGGASVGGKAASAAFSHYVVVQLASVLAPGLVIVAEAALLVGRLIPTSQDSDLAALSRVLSSMRGSILVVAVVVVLATSFVIGYVCRELGFWLESRLEVRRAKRRSRSAAPADGAAADPPPQDLRHLAHARKLFGGDAVDSCVAYHPILRTLEDEDGLAVVSGTASQRRHWSEFVPERENAVFHYCKMWLRRHVPALSVDQTETEINILVAMVIPVILLGAVILAWLPNVLVAATIAVPVVVTIIPVLTWQAARLRRGERWDAIRNLIFDHMMRTALSRYPVAAPDEPALIETGSEEAS